MTSIQRFLVRLIRSYQGTFSPDTGRYGGNGSQRVCVFYPTCSEYTATAICKYGSARGLFMGFRRVLRCHPWQKRHIDPVP